MSPDLDGARLVLDDDFDGDELGPAVRLPIDVEEFHSYAVDRAADRADFLVDGAQRVVACDHRRTRCR